MSSEHLAGRIRTGIGRADHFAFDADDGRDGLVEELDNVMRLLGEPRLQRGAVANDRAPVPRVAGERSPSELDAALEMIKRAAEAMNLMEDRSRQLQTQAETFAEQSRRDVASANEKAAALQRRALSSEARADELEARLREAEDRAKAADEWLARFHDTITTAFSTRRPAAARRAA